MVIIDPHAALKNLVEESEPDVRCRNKRCNESDYIWDGRGHYGLCPSCWWMAKTSFAVGAASLTVIAFIVGMIGKWLVH
jgi:hypothetical protein